jgi:hypothetical protein
MLNRTRIFTSAALIALVTVSFSLVVSAEKETRPVKSKSVTKPTTTTAAPKTESAPKQVTIPPVTPQTEIAPLPQPTIIDSLITQPLSSPAAGEQIKWQVIAGGGSMGASASYKLGSTVGQTAAGQSASASYKLNAGFWQNFSNGCCVKEGDVNHNNTVNVADVTFLVKFLFQSGPAPVCTDEGNVNDLGSINVADVTYLVKFLFQSGPITPCP